MVNRRVVVAGMIWAAASVASPAFAGWGCMATDAREYAWYAWGGGNEAVTRTYVMSQLCEPAKHGGCRIVECRTGIDNQAQADALWKQGGRSVGCKGNATGC